MHNISICCTFSPARRGCCCSSDISFGFLKEASICRIEKAPNVGIEYPVDVALFNAYRDCIQRMVRAASRSGTVREAEKLLLVNGVEHLDSRPLDDFVSQRRLADGALAPISFRYVDALDRWGL